MVQASPPALLIIDKENADKREGIFIIDASRGFKKDGNKNRLREQDIEKIVQTFINEEKIEGYSTFVTYKDILKKEGNDGNLNVPRYIQKIDDTLPQNIASHLMGGIPEVDIDSIEKLWNVSPDLKQRIFTCVNEKHSVYNLAISPSEIEAAIAEDGNIKSEKVNECEDLFEAWKSAVKDALLNINTDTNPKELIRNLGVEILNHFASTRLLDNYDIYDFLLNYWNDKLQDDVYVIKASGYEAGREIEYVYAQKKAKDEAGETISVDDTSKMKSFDGSLISREIIEREYFEAELTALNELTEKSALLESKLDEMREEESGEDGLLKEALNANGDGIPKANLNKRIKELDSKKTSSVIDDINRLLELLDASNIAEMEKIVKANKELANYELRNKNSTFGKAKIKSALKEAADNAVLPEIYADEYNALLAYQTKLSEKDEADKAVKDAQKKLDEVVLAKYGELSIEEIKYLLFDEKWIARLGGDITDAFDQELNVLASRVTLIAKRYARTLGEIEDKTAKSKDKVKSALERMGYKW